MDPSAPRKINKYDVLDLIGRGGMGVVYKAVDRSLDRLVAIKMVTNAEDPSGDLLKRFYRESQFTANLRHQNIVTVYELGDFEGRPYLVMEYLAGQSLDSMLARQPLLLQQRISYVRQVCNGLQYAHSRQPSIVHRDIKPANIVILEDGTAKIVDFGIARIGQSNYTRSGQLMGSYHYMSPEQIEDRELDGRSDIFSAGVVLYQLLTLTLPFEGNGVVPTLHRIVNSPPPPLNQFLKDYPPGLDDIISRALAKNRDERYQSAGELAFDLMQVESDLRRGLFADYIERAENFIHQGELESAKHELIRVLDTDNGHVRANELMREVQAQIMRQQRKRRARDLRGHAQEALERNQLDVALGFLDQAVGLDNTDTGLHAFRDHVRDLRSRSLRLTELMDHAERLCAAYDLEGAAQAVSEALEMDPTSPRANTLKPIIEAKFLEREKKRQVQDLLASARQLIGLSQFSQALDSLKKAGKLDPTVSGLRDLVSVAETGQRELEKRKVLQNAADEITEAFESKNLTLALNLVDLALGKFPQEHTLLDLKDSVEKEIQSRRREKSPPSRVAPNPTKRDSPPPPGSSAPGSSAPGSSAPGSLAPGSFGNTWSSQSSSSSLRKPRPQDQTVAELTPLEGIGFPGASANPSVRDGSDPVHMEVSPTAAVPSGISQETFAGTAAQPPKVRLWPADVLQGVEKRLAVFIGPLARVVVERTASSTDNPEEFFRLLATKIARPEDREAFLAGSAQLIRSQGQVRSKGQSTQLGPEPTGLAAESRVGLTADDIDRAARLLARYVGPLAGVLAKKAAQQTSGLSSLYTLLGQHIKSESDRAKFLRESGVSGRG